MGPPELQVTPDHGQSYTPSDPYSRYLSLEPAALPRNLRSHAGVSPVSTHSGSALGQEGGVDGTSRPTASSHNSSPSAQTLVQAGNYTPNPQISHLGLAVKILLFSLGLVAGIIVPIIVWLWYIFISQSTFIDRQKGLVYTTATGPRFNLISTVSLKVATLLISQVLATHAYVAASEWLAPSKTPAKDGSTKKLPTPMHLATTMSIYQNAGIIALASSIKDSRQAPAGSPAWPPLLKQAFFLLAWLLTVTTSMHAVELWLQVSAVPSNSVPTSTDFASMGYTKDNTLFARTFNWTQCNGYLAGYPGSVSARTCGLQSGGSASGRGTVDPGIQAYTNTSAISKTAWLDDNTAILVPAGPPLIGYTSKALGVKANCQSITTQCTSCSSYTPDTAISCQGPEAFINLQCKGQALYNVTIPYPSDPMSTYQSGPLSVVNGSAILFGVERNPFPFGQVVPSYGYFEASLGTDYFVGNSGFVVHGHAGGINVMFCEISVLDITYEFMPPSTYEWRSKALANMTSTRYIGYASFPSTSVTAVIDGSGQATANSAGTYADNYGRQLAKWIIGTSAYLLGEYPVEKLLPGRTAGTQVPLAAVSTLLVLDGLLILTTIGVLLHSVIVVLSQKNPYVKAARGRILSDLPLIGDALGGLAHDFDLHAHAVSSGDSRQDFAPESEQDRLLLVEEKVLAHSPGPGGTVGVMKRTARLKPMRRGDILGAEPGSSA